MRHHGWDNELLFEQIGVVGVITLNRMQARNALSYNMYKGLADICAAPSKEVKSLVIRGAGDLAFAAGTDMKQFRELHSDQDFLDYEIEIDRVLSAIETSPVPTIAAIAGACTGGGGMIASVCDLRIAAANMKFGFPIARTLGNSLSASSLARLEVLLGSAKVREMIFTSRLIEADEAQRIGLVAEVMDDAEALFDRAISLANRLVEQAPLTLYATKVLQHRLLKQRIADVVENDMVLQCYQSEDFREGMEAFLAKRKPKWQGK